MSVEFFVTWHVTLYHIRWFSDLLVSKRTNLVMQTHWERQPKAWVMIDSPQHAPARSEDTCLFSTHACLMACFFASSFTWKKCPWSTTPPFAPVPLFLFCSPQSNACHFLATSSTCFLYDLSGHCHKWSLMYLLICMSFMAVTLAFHFFHFISRDLRFELLWGRD